MAYWLNSNARDFLSKGYLQEGQSAEERIREIAEAAERILNKTGFADKFEQYMLNGWISLASPIWANFGTNRGLPVSCNGSYVADDTHSILNKVAEIGMMTKHGAGTSAYLGAIRPRGSQISGGGLTDGPVRFAELLETTTSVISQSNVRRGACAIYLDADHPDLAEFLEAREEGHFIQRLSLGVCISDAWMQSMLDGDKDKRKLWARILKKRFETGYPYLFFTDTVNKSAPQVYKDKGHAIYASQLCSEIALSSSAEESFVCCLSSLNLLHYDDWKDTDLPQTVAFFLDAVMSEYIEKTADIPLMEAAHRFSKNQRAIGIGVLGWHSFLQSKMLAFDSWETKRYNVEIHKLIRDKTIEASRDMAQEYGEPPLLEGYGLRNATLMAIAPTTSSSFILGQVSPSIEPFLDNYHVDDLQKGKYTFKNPYLEKLLMEKRQDTPEVWRSILIHGGSVQHLDFLTEDERNVFKTFGEISQKEIVIQAAARQKYIDQSQSLNFMIHPDTPVKEVSQLLIEAWEMGVKTIYYQRSMNKAQQKVRSILQCSVCES